MTTPVPHHSFFTGRMPFLPPNQQHQSTEGNTSRTESLWISRTCCEDGGNSSQPTVSVKALTGTQSANPNHDLAFPFFIHHWIPTGRGVVHFMPPIQHQYQRAHSKLLQLVFNAAPIGLQLTQSQAQCTAYKFHVSIT